MPAPLPDGPVGGSPTALSEAQLRTVAQAALELPGRAEQVLAEPTHRALGRVVRDAVLFLLPGHPAHDVPTEQLVTATADALDGLAALQLPSGAFCGGDNVDSPPDTAFTINDLAWARTALAAADADASIGADALLERLDPLLEAATPALVHGGLHTPNHRWEIASALCRLWEALGDPAARDRAEQWLAEGVDLQADGMFSERSANYAAHVSVPALLAMGRILERPALLDAADVATRRQADLTDATGMVETLASRRQDQFERFDGGALHPWFRAHAARTQDPLTARAARRTADRADADSLLTLLALGTEDLRVLGALPAPAADPTPEQPEVVELSVSGLVRADHGTSSTVLFGGTDTARLGRVTSGTSSQPVLARFLGRSAGVRELRLSRDFFSLGPLRPGAPIPVEAPDGALRYTLEEEVGGEYFQPLPPAEQRADGGYDLEFNGRFAAAMSFSRRPVETLTLRTTMQATLRADELSLRWDFVGPTTPICLLVALDGLVPGADLRRDGQGRHVLEPADDVPAADGASSARCVLRGAEEQLEIEVEGDLGGRAFYDPGEAYSFLGATDEPGGDVLLLPATTAGPLALTLRITPLR
ncbi:hypothetical protein CFK41_16360 [Brachybacterium ginsengisoli]|uniref:Uncharacterized protein n=1 Tax=Brachybacterium ginsengisoli TaxID=1331682 RepID=A0A291H1D2_9MICO|nr:hypothetical protein [Brachybacterium ginsengisoli]ATG56174.1 hypothetical protein CFK41_16360 [Brachybacterium ginsengisoli]